MHNTSVFCIRVKGELGTDWSDYFGAQSISLEVDEAGCRSTILISEPLDQAGLVGMINNLNGIGLSVVSVECMPTPTEDEPSMQADA